MTWMTIDQDKCIKCGLCRADCPRGALLFTDDYLPVPEESKACVHCGHCAAICPPGAVTLDGLTPEELDQTPQAGQELFAPLSGLMRSRRSIRDFKRDPLGRALLEEVMEAVNYAPTGANMRSVRWTIVQSPDELKRLASIVVEWMRSNLDAVAGTPYEEVYKMISRQWDEGKDFILWHAPALAVAHAKAPVVTPMHDCVIAITYLELAAWSKGIGSCWGGFFNRCAGEYKPMRDALGLEEGEAIYGSLMLGYPAQRYPRLPHRAPAPISWK